MVFGSGGLNEARAGRVRVLAVTSARRSAALRKSPPCRKRGSRIRNRTLWFGILAPATRRASCVGSRRHRQGARRTNIRERFNTWMSPEHAGRVRRLHPARDTQVRKVFEPRRSSPNEPRSPSRSSAPASGLGGRGLVEARGYDVQVYEQAALRARRGGIQMIQRRESPAPARSRSRSSGSRTDRS